MKTNKFFTILLVMMALAFAINGQSEASKTISNENDAQSLQVGRLEGTFMVTATFTNIEFCEGGKCEPIPVGELPPPFKVLFTFMAGKTANDGTLIDTNEFQMTGNPVCTPDQGIWERKLANQFILTQYNFCFDSMNGYGPAGTSKIRASLQLNNRGDGITGRQYIEGFDAKGMLVFIGEVNLAGPRIIAEEPPE